MIRTLLLCVLLIPTLLLADVVKPTMIDISVSADGQASLEMHVSIEALLTGINNRFRNTKNAPQAAAYDKLRALVAPELAQHFEPFKQKLLEGISLKFDGERVPLSITKVDIPEPGYLKVPRASVVYLEGEIPRGSRHLTWYFPKRFSNNAVRIQQVDEAREQWRWSD